VLVRTSAANENNTWGKKMSELDLFGFIGTNRSIFATFFLCGVLMPLGVVIVAYLFRRLSYCYSRWRDGVSSDRGCDADLLLYGFAERLFS
jgi:hypothetical protein